MPLRLGYKMAISRARTGKGVRGERGKRKVHTVMSEYKKGNLHSGGKRGPQVKSREQAIAIALSEGRKV